MIIDVGFSKVTDAHYQAGQIVTVKPGGAQWTAEETAELGIATLDLPIADFNALMADPGAFKVDSLESPQTVIQGV